MAFAGSERWLPAALADRLRTYVEDGGRVASFGADSMRRLARIDGDVATVSGRPRAANVFGERLRPVIRTGAAPLAVQSDELGLFAGGDSFVGEFTLFEPSAALPEGAELLTAAGLEPEEPDLVGYRLGKGLVVRLGTPQWAAQLARDRLGLELPRATVRLWSVLTRGSSGS